MTVRETDLIKVAGDVESGGTVVAAIVTLAVADLVASCTLLAVIVMF